METVEVTIKVTSTRLSDYLAVKKNLQDYSGDTLGTNPSKEVVREDEINFVNEIKIIAETAV